MLIRCCPNRLNQRFVRILFIRNYSQASRNDPFDVLGVSKDASKQEIKEAYLKLSKSLHPDLNKSPNASEEFQKVKNAFDELSNNSSRKDVNDSQRGSNQVWFHLIIMHFVILSVLDFPKSGL